MHLASRPLRHPPAPQRPARPDRFHRRAATPNGIAAGPDGALWFTEEKAGQIGRVTPAGAVAEYVFPTPDSTPVGIVTGTGRILWFAEQNKDQIGRITLA